MFSDPEHIKKINNLILSTEDIIGKINAAGFEIASAKEVSLNREQAAEFYKEHAEQEYFDKLVTHMSRLEVIHVALFGLGKDIIRVSTCNSRTSDS